MRVALISDIHANLDALEAVLADLPPADRVVCCGDIVGYYDRPNEVCALIRDRGIACIRGNHDAYVVGAIIPKAENRLAYRTDWTRETLIPAHREWLAGLGTEMSVDADGRRLRLRHASPWDEETYLYPDADGALARVRIGRDEILAVGHTHRPLHRRIDEGWLVNPGSVGQPRDWNPLAAYAMVDMSTGAIEPRRVGYGVALMQTRLAAQGWDPGLTALLSRTPEP
jgi:predicted phosphodiesterase